jgi:hypothetical protein
MESVLIRVVGSLPKPLKTAVIINFAVKNRVAINIIGHSHGTWRNGIKDDQKPGLQSKRTVIKYESVGSGRLINYLYYTLGGC